jgi:hypothetical protein
MDSDIVADFVVLFVTMPLPRHFSQFALRKNWIKVGLEKDINHYMFQIFYFLLNIWKDLKVLSRFMQNWIQCPAFLYHVLHRILLSYWLAHFYLMKKNLPKCFSILVWIAGCWNSLLTGRNPKNNWCLSNIFGARVGGKDCGLSTCKPWSKQAGGWIHFCIKRLRSSELWTLIKY